MLENNSKIHMEETESNQNEIENPLEESNPEDPSSGKVMINFKSYLPSEVIAELMKINEIIDNSTYMSREDWIKHWERFERIQKFKKRLRTFNSTNLYSKIIEYIKDKEDFNGPFTLFLMR